jgi:hypothetical protein
LSPNSQHLHFSFTVVTLSKIFLLEVVAIGRKNFGWESDNKRDCPGISNIA